MKNRNRSPGLPIALAALTVLALFGCRAESAEPEEHGKPETFVVFAADTPEDAAVPPDDTVRIEDPADTAETEGSADAAEGAGTVVLLGDSLTDWGDFSRYFASADLHNLGVAGNTIVQVTERMDQVKALSPDLLLILCGINSLSDARLSSCLEEYDALASAAAAIPGNPRIVIQSVLPISEEFMRIIPCSEDTIRTFNDGLRGIAEKYGFEYLELYDSFAVDGAMDPELTPDGVHLNEKGYDVWAAILAPYIEEAP